MRTVKSYKCPCCTASYKSLKPWANHVRTHHPEWVIEGFSDQRLFYYALTGKVHGNCIICKDPTEWNEETGKYNRFCDKPQCKEEYRKVFKKRMVGKYGRVHLCNDPEQQRKMLAGRKISGKVAFPDGAINYVGSYERDFLEMLRDFLGFHASDIMGPSPHTYHYVFEGQDHFYIPDFYIPNLNLEVEIKTHKTTHQKFVEVEFKREAAKTEMMKTVKSVNYIVVADKDYTEFFNKVAELRAGIEENDLKGNAPKRALESQGAEQYTEDHKAIESVLQDMNGLIFHKNPVMDHFVIEMEGGSEVQFRFPATEAGLPEADPDKKWYPVYVVCMHAGTGLANVIKFVTGDKYSHAALSLDSSMDTMYSFGDKERVKGGAMKGLGFEIDSKESFHYTEIEQKCLYRINAIFMKKPDFEAAKARVRYFVENQAKFKYDFVGLIKYLLHMDSENQWSYFCSGFVADVLKTGKAIKSKDSYSRYTPQRLADLRKSYCVAHGQGIHLLDVPKLRANTKKAFEKYKKTYKLPDSAVCVIE